MLYVYYIHYICIVFIYIYLYTLYLYLYLSLSLYIYIQDPGGQVLRAMSCLPAGDQGSPANILNILDIYDQTFNIYWLALPWLGLAGLGSAWL